MCPIPFPHPGKGEDPYHDKNSGNLLLDTLTDAVVSTDTNFIIRHWNRAASELYGLRPDEAIGRPAAEIFNYQYLTDSREIAKKKLTGQGYWTGNVIYTQKNGQKIILQASVNTARNASGEPIAYVACNRDITTLQAAKDNIRREEREDKIFLNALAEGLVVQDRQAEILVCNEAAENILGLTAKQMTGRSSLDPNWRSIHDDGSDFPGHTHPSLVALQTGRPQRNVIMGVHKPDGSLTWISINAQPVFSDSNALPEAVVCTFFDITEQLNIRNELAKSNERYDLAGKATADAIWDWDILSDRVNFEEGYTNMFGFKENHIPMETKLSFIHPRQSRSVRKSLERALAAKDDHWEAEYLHLCTNGDFKIVLNKAYILRDAGSRPIRMIGAIRDLSEQRRLEKVLIEKEMQKKTEIVRAILESQEKDRKEIAFELHDNVNQVLSTCKLLLEMAEKDPESSAVYISQTRKTLQEVIQEIRNIAGNLAPYALKDLGLIPSIEEMIRKINATGKIELHLRQVNPIKDDRLSWEIKLSLFRILQEQINNVMKHADADKVQITLSQSADTISLTVRDDGKGFDKGKVKKGLGLNNIFNRVEFYKGTVQLETSPGKGCTLKVNFTTS